MSLHHMESIVPPSGFDAPLTLETASTISAAPSPTEACQDESDYFQETDETGSSLSDDTYRDRTPIISRIWPGNRAIDRLPDEMLIAIFSYIETQYEFLCIMQVCRQWAACVVEYLWHRPLCPDVRRLEIICNALNDPNSFFPYGSYVKRVNLSAIANMVNDGTITALNHCTKIEKLTLAACNQVTDGALARLIKVNPRLSTVDVSLNTNITDVSINALAENCGRLLGLNVAGCSAITSESLCKLATGCPSIKRLKLNDCVEVTDSCVVAFAENCPNILEIDLQMCQKVTDISVTTLLNNSKHIRELRLPHVNQITDATFLDLKPQRIYDTLRILDLTGCAALTDVGVCTIIQAAPRLRNVILAKCRLITDRAVTAIAKLGKNLHYIHLGHCANLTDNGLRTLISHCNRIRYIDLACCVNLTDSSVCHLSTLPKLKRIGLVKCAHVTDTSIIKIANSCFMRAQRAAFDGSTGSSLERVHLSYCMNLTMKSIIRLLNACKRLTHLSLTGVPSFLLNDIQRFGREPPRDFNDNQRDMFCVFSGQCVEKLRSYLNQSPKYHNIRIHAGIRVHADGSIDFRPDIPEDIAFFPTSNQLSPGPLDGFPGPNLPYDPLLGVDQHIPTQLQFQQLIRSVQGHAVMLEHTRAQIFMRNIEDPPPPNSVPAYILELATWHREIHHNYINEHNAEPPIEWVAQQHLQRVATELNEEKMRQLYPQGIHGQLAHHGNVVPIAGNNTPVAPVDVVGVEDEMIGGDEDDDMVV